MCEYRPLISKAERYVTVGKVEEVDGWCRYIYTDAEGNATKLGKCLCRSAPPSIWS